MRFPYRIVAFTIRGKRETGEAAVNKNMEPIYHMGVSEPCSEITSFIIGYPVAVDSEVVHCNL